MTVKRSTIVRYSADLPPEDAYPRKIVSPPTAGPCCLQHSRQVGKERKDAGWRYIYVRCQVCGYAVRRILGRARPRSRRPTTTPAQRWWRLSSKRSRRSDLVRRRAA